MKRSEAIRDHEEGASASRALAFISSGPRCDELLKEASHEEDLAAAARNGTYPDELDD